MPLIKTTSRREIRTAARAVPLEQDRLYGIVRFDIRQNPATLGHIKGFSVPFIVSGQEDISFMPDQAFLYGSQSDLKFNYHRAFPNGFFDEQYQDVKIGKAQSAKWLIPLEAAQLGISRKKVIDEILRAPYDFAGETIDHLVELSVRDLPDGSLGQYFSTFPIALRKEAEKLGVFYANRESLREEIKGKSYFIVPGRRKPRELLTPMGGLPEWAQKIWRNKT